MDPAQVEEADLCGLCGEPMIEGAAGDQEPRGSYHYGCLKKAREALFGQEGRGPFEDSGGRRRRRRS